MDAYNPWVLALLAFAFLPFFRMRPGTIFRFSSFAVLPRSRAGANLSSAVKLLAALAIAGSVFGAAEITLRGVTQEIISEGAQIVFVRDCSSSMFGSIKYRDPIKIDLIKIDIATGFMTMFLRARSGADQYGLVDFGSAAVTRSGLEFDRQKILGLLDARCPDLWGTVIDNALERAIGLFPGEPSFDSRAVILVSDGGGRMNNSVDLARWMRERNIYFWWVFIGTEDEWKWAKEVHELVSILGSRAAKFRADTSAALEEVMSRIRTLQRGLIRYPETLPEYPLRNFFYGFAGAACLILGALVLAELWLRPQEKR